MSGTPFQPSPTDISSPFWQGLAERRLMLQVDSVTGRPQFYPRPLGPDSATPPGWREASGRGHVRALTLSRVAPAGWTGELPYLLALIVLEEGPRVLARISTPTAGLVPGDAVELDWQACGPSPAFPVFRRSG